MAVLQDGETLDKSLKPECNLSQSQAHWVES
jgi:hypothetical protein